MHQVDEDAVRQALQTEAPSWLPWSRARPYDPDVFAKDLEPIVAFYRDHGYPDARVVDHDVQIDEAAGTAAITIRIHEGEPLPSAASSCPDSKCCPIAR